MTLLASLSALVLLLLAASSLLTAVVHRRPRWTSPRAPPSLPTTTMPLALSSLHPRLRTKTCTLARQWRAKAHASAHLRTVPENPLQPPRCCHRAVAVALCANAALRAATTAADAAAAAALPPSCSQRRAVALPPPPQHLRCCNGAAAITLCTAAALHAAATAAADAAAAAVPPPSFRQCHAGALPPLLLMPKLPPTSHCCAAAAAAASALLPPRCRRRAVRRRRAAAMLPPTSRLPLLIVIFPLILMPSSHLTPPLFCQYTPRSPHIVHVTQITIKHCVGWCVVLTNPMDCAQTKRMRHRPWCVDDAYALGWGALTPHATVWAKTAQHHGCGEAIKKNLRKTGSEPRMILRRIM
jgi:hypothetical protein